MRWLGVVGLFWCSAASAAERTYELLEPQSFLFVEVKPDEGLLSRVSHAHVVRATRWKGTVRWDPERPAECKIELEIPVAGLVVDEPAMRKRLGMEKSISDVDRARVKESMLEEGQLFGAKFPDIRFTAVSCKPSGATVEVTGDLEIRGKKKRFTAPMKVQLAGDRLKVQGKFQLHHQDFGFEPYSAALGAIRNDETLTFQVRAVGVAK